MGVRKNQKDMTNAEWMAFIAAIDAMHGTAAAMPAYRRFTHNAVGGDMAGAASPTDPLFWLHHAFIDKTWADWQASPNGKNPPNMTEVLKPVNMQTGVPFGVSVSSLLSIAALGYSYA